MPSTTTKVTGLLLGGLAAAGALTATAFGSAPSAQASCISAFGFSTSPNCRSTIASVALALGPNTAAYADGFLGGAFTLGSNSTALSVPGSVGTLAAALGTGNTTVADGYVSVGLNAGINSTVVAGTPGNVGNLAVNLVNTQTATTVAAGYGNIAVNLLGSGSIYATGLLTSAANLGGPYNAVGTSGTFTNAMSVFGNSNTVVAGPGPAALAASFFQTSRSITKTQPGININGFRVPNTAASSPASATRQGVERAGAAAAGRSGKD